MDFTLFFFSCGETTLSFCLSLCMYCTHLTTVSQTNLTLFIWLSLSRIYNLSKIRPWAMEIMAVHASSICACTRTLAKYVAKSNLIVVVVIVVVIFVVSRQFERSTAIPKHLGPVSYTHLTLPTILLV